MKKIGKLALYLYAFIVLLIIGFEVFVYFQTGDLFLLIVSVAFFGMLFVLMLRLAKQMDTKNKTVVKPKRVDVTPQDRLMAESIIDSVKMNYKKPCIRFDIEERETGLFESKLGGSYILMKGMDIPSVNGYELKLLAQLNLNDLPKLEGYPQKGLLQFFVADDHLWGLGFDKEPSKFMARYIEDIPGSDEYIIIDSISENMPFDGTKSFALMGINDESYPDNSCIEFESILKKEVPELLVDRTIGVTIKNDAVDQMVRDAFSNSGTLMGGYPFFTQWDPRDNEEYVLLFQLDSDLKHVCWGDSGVGNFFIKKEDLLNLNFNNVLYNWDCY